MATVQARILKGFRDHLPEFELPRQRMFETIRGVFESFGFGPLMTPALEYSEVLLGQYGDEGEKLLYRFADNGDRDVSLRYDLTVPLARVIAQNRNLPLPFKRYQIAPVWRAEKPGRGRFREFFQCDVDIVGEPSTRADIECMIVGLSVLEALNVPAFVMRVNNRKILDGLMEIIGLPMDDAGTDRRHAVMRCIDKLPKVGRDAVAAEIRAEVGLGDDAIETLFDVLERKVSGPEGVESLREILGASEAASAGIDELKAVLATLDDAGWGPAIEVDLSIARGLNYYTSTIYETFLVGHENFGSVMSGGRYDTLLGMFLKQSIPAVGISLGVDRLLSALVELKILKASPTPADVYIALFDDGGYAFNIKLAAALRRAGIKSEAALKAGKVGKQFKLAERKGYTKVLLAGPDERAAGHVKLKDLTTGEQETLSASDVSEWAASLI